MCSRPPEAEGRLERPKARPAPADEPRRRAPRRRREPRARSDRREALSRCVLGHPKPKVASSGRKRDPRRLMNLADELLAVAANRELARIDEKLYLDVFSATRSRRSPRAAESETRD